MTAAPEPEAHFDRGLALYRANQLPAAAAILDRVVKQEPARSEAWHLLGVVRSLLDDREGALDALERAVALRPDDADALGNLARLQIKRQRDDLAEPLLRRVLTLAPDNADLWRNLVGVRRRLEDISGAVEAARKLQELRPEDAAVLGELGGLLSRAGDPRGAHAQYLKAAELDPDAAPVQIQLAESLRGMGQIPAAKTAAERALVLDPDYAPGYAALGDILRMMEDFKGAAAALDRALAIAPDLFLGNFYKGLLENDLCHVDAAIAHMDKALALRPDHPDLHWNRAVMNIRRGRWREGFAEYEWRFRSNLFIGGPRPPLPVRPTPDELRGQRVWLTAEQGIGDVIQFLRYADLVAKAGARPIAEVPAELMMLARSAPGAAEVVARGGKPPPHDIALPMMSLPHVFGTEIATVPADIPYLHPDPAAVAAWKRRLADLPTPRIGIAWQGNPLHRNDHNRSIALSRLKPLIESLPAGWVSLQKGAGSEQIASADLSGRLFDAGPALGNFADTAALLANLDLVVTIDSAVAHLAGALGRETLLLLPWSPDFRWMLDRADTPWYPTLRLLRQAQRRDWTKPLAELQLTLTRQWPHLVKGMAGHRRPPGSPSSPYADIGGPDDDVFPQQDYERLRFAGRLDEAAALLEAALARRPEDPALLTELSVIERKRKHPDAALAFARRALAKDGRFLPALLALGAALSDFDRHAEAAAAYERALALEPRNDIALVNLSALRLREGRSIEAEALGRQAIAVAPDRPHSHWHLALALLTNGKYREGWAEYEWRWATGLLDREKRDWPWPTWQGEALEGRLLVWTEQGIGDELMFASLLPELVGRMKLALECEPRLVPLMARSLPGVILLERRQGPVVMAAWPGDIVAQISAGNLMRYLRPDPASFAGRGGPYLTVDTARREAARQRYGTDRLCVGIAWHTGSHNAGTSRTVPLALLKPLLRVPGVRFVNLQYGDHREELAALAAEGIELFQDPTFDQLTDLVGFAAQVAALDLVITIDNSTAHMAGALGVPCWVLLPNPSEWRWLRARSDCLWWPSLRLFRQTVSGDWSAPLASLQDAFVAWAKGRKQADRLFADALRRFEAGQIDEAKAGLENLLRDAPDHALAWQLLGVSLSRSGPPEAALVALRRAASLAPQDAQAAENLGKFLFSQKAWGEAAAQLARARQMTGNHPDLAEKQASALIALRRFGDAADALGAARQFKPGDGDLARRQASLLRDAGRLEEAARVAEARIEQSPNDPEMLRQWVEIERSRKQPQRALELARRIIALAPDAATGYGAEAVALGDLEAWDAAEAAGRKALALEPGNGHIAAILCGVVMRLGHSEEAERFGRMAVAKAPDNAIGHWNLAHALLTNGNYREGWAEYEWRWRTGMLDREKRDWPWPEWQGEPLAGRRLLVHTEQGFGDALQFARLLRRVKAEGATLLLEAQKELMSLFAGLEGVDRLIQRGSAFPPVDFQIPLMSLPHRVGLSLGDLPGPVPYLSADPASIARWERKLADLPRPRIGLCWRGGRGHDVDHWRSAALSQVMPIIRAAPAASFVSLQKLDDGAEIDAAGLKGRLRSVAAELGDFADTAGLVETLDLVISVDTAVGHLAGALGKPVWLLLAAAADFRWMRDRSDSPWYPRHRLFRQARDDDWSRPVAEIAAALPRFLAEIRESHAVQARPQI
jgi:tetratricopeptide (TPR) repeat protein